MTCRRQASAESREAFADHLEKYTAHVKTRAEVKKKEDAERAARGGDEEYEYVPLEKGEQLGPGGLDPAEVFESLPREMQEAFGDRDIDALKRILQAPADPPPSPSLAPSLLRSRAWRAPAGLACACGPARLTVPYLPQAMDPDEASRHMKRCVDSGLWNPTGGEGSPDDDEAEAEGRAKPSEVDSSPSAEVDD